MSSGRASVVLLAVLVLLVGYFIVDQKRAQWSAEAADKRAVETLLCETALGNLMRTPSDAKAEAVVANCREQGSYGTQALRVKADNALVIAGYGR